MVAASGELAGRRVLVTGASGFIGRHLCRRLVRSGAEVFGLSRRDRESEPGGPQWTRGDLTDPDLAGRLFDAVRPEVVFHLASHVVGARDLDQVLPTFRDNLATTVNLLTAAAGSDCRRLVLAGSLEEPDWTAEAAAGPPVPSSPYAAAKFAASAYARLFHALYETPAVIARIFMVYGPHQADLRKLVPYVTLSLLRGESPELTAGTREVDWIYVEEVARGLVALATAPGVEGRTLDLGSGELTTVRGVVELVHEIIGSEAGPRFGTVADRPMEQVRRADVEATARAAGWRPKLDLRAGLERTVDWYRRRLSQLVNEGGG